MMRSDFRLADGAGQVAKIGKIAHRVRGTLLQCKKSLYLKQIYCPKRAVHPDFT